MDRVRRAFLPMVIVSACGLVSCAETVDAATSRYVAPGSAASAAAPICFRPASTTASLSERARYEEAVDKCTVAAFTEGVAVANKPGCWLAELNWQAEYSGRTEGSCYGHTCEVSDLFNKRLVVKVTNPATGRVEVESSASITSDTRYFKQHTVFALCSAAFRRYPRATRNEEMEIELPR